MCRCYECGKPLSSHRNDTLGDDTCPSCRAEEDRDSERCQKCGEKWEQCHCGLYQYADDE